MEIVSRQIIDDSIYLATELLEIAKKKETRKEKSKKRQFARLVKDNHAIKATQQLTDQVIRIDSSKASAKMFRSIVRKVKSKGFSLIDYFGLKLLGLFSYVLRPVVLFIVTERIRIASKGIINSANPRKLKKYLRKKSKANVDINLNLLGEAVLGEEEADKRFKDLLNLMELDDVNYISVKISAIVSQIIPSDLKGSYERVAQKLRVIYRKSLKNNCFINLDMEEFKDFEITLDVFKQLLMEEEFKNLYAGIVLQAYLPEAHSAFDDLLSWSKKRYEAYGSKIKIRLVKGANLAMERTEAELHGWNPAPYNTKAEVDASYSRLINIGLSKENKDSLVIGVASHNLFHIAFAQQLAELREVTSMVEIEMLEGMANAEAMAVKQKFGSVLLYSPITLRKDFPAAVAYLVRRLDENTSEENYLRASFTIDINNKEFNQQAKRFLDSVHMSHVVSLESKRRTSTAPEKEELYNNNSFANQADEDITSKKFVDAVVNKLYMFGKSLIPVVVSGKEELNLERVTVGEPGEGNKPFYSHNVANLETIEDAVRIAKFEQKNWSETKPQKIYEIFGNVAKNMENDRARVIAAMIRDSGKTIEEANVEVSEAIDFARLYGLTALNPSEGSQPCGLVVVASPWNFPYAIPAGGIIAALVSGNTVIFKPAPEVVLVGWELVNQLWKSGIPKQALHFVPTLDNEVGQKLISHRDVDKVVLTGAYDTAIKFKSWRPNLDLVAETSGKNSIIVTNSSDIDLAVYDIVKSAFGHAGQKCSAGSLAIVEKETYNNPLFFKQLVDATNSLSVGNPTDLGTSMGPIIKNPDEKLLRALTELEEGEEWLVKPKALSNSNCWTPGIKINVQPNSWTHMNEWFGPVLGIMKAPNLKKAIEWQNATEYGLTAGLHSLSTKECNYWLKNVEAGNLYINRPITGAVVNRQPFGGWKKSSFGPTVKAGSSFYPSIFKKYEEVKDYDMLVNDLQELWNVKSKKIKNDDLQSEHNYSVLYPHKKVLIVQDENPDPEIKKYLDAIKKIFGMTIDEIKYSKLEDNDFIHKYSLVRWLSKDPAPEWIYKYNFSIDTNHIVQDHQRELFSWTREQSVSITNHRYGNIGFSPVSIENI
jgi:RHH-type proline utilization regulon transcriptional repressor/proline dehydrogenase/delta 1-pyrroline-5-carboxylate dehydrogenase